MALNFEQYKNLRAKGLSEEQILKFEDGIKPIKKPEVKTGLSGIAQVIGESAALNSKDFQASQKSAQDLGNINLKLLQTIRENKKLGKDTSRLERQYKILVPGPNYSEIKHKGERWGK